jgi:hypothetical protein
MRLLFLYLRRALAGTARAVFGTSGYKSPLVVFGVQEFNRKTVSLCAFAVTERIQAVHHCPCSQHAQAFHFGHVQILPARSQRRHGPLVLGFAGGNA